MAMNRVQFQPGLSMFAGCAYQCSLIVGTLFESSKLPLTRWFMALQLITQAKNGISALELMRQLQVSYPTAWLLKHKVMEAMRLHEADRQLSGRVEMDDAYLGGQRHGGKSGRGSENKVPFVVAVQTTAGGLIDRVCMAQLPFRRSAIQEFVQAHTARPLTVVSDGLDCFAATRTAGVHERVVTGGGSQAARHPKCTARCLADVQFRINHRYRLDLMLVAIARSLLTNAPITRPLIRAPEVRC